MDNEFNFKQELRNIFEKELLGKTTNAGRIYRKLLARDKEFIKKITDNLVNKGEVEYVKKLAEGNLK